MRTTDPEGFEREEEVFLVEFEEAFEDNNTNRWLKSLSHELFNATSVTDGSFQIWLNKKLTVVEKGLEGPEEVLPSRPAVVTEVGRSIKASSVPPNHPHVATYLYPPQPHTEPEAALGFSESTH